MVTTPVALVGALAAEVVRQVLLARKDVIVLGNLRTLDLQRSTIDAISVLSNPACVVCSRPVESVAEPSTGFDPTTIATGLVVIVAMLFLAVRLIPQLTQAAFQLLPMVLIVWFIVEVLRGIVKGLLP